MSVVNQDVPLIPGQTFVPEPSIGLLAPAAPAEGVGSGIPWIVHCATGPAQRERRQGEFILVCASGHPCREKQTLLPEVFDRRTQAASPSEGLKEKMHRFLDLLVGIENHVPGRVVD